MYRVLLSLVCTGLLTACQTTTRDAQAPAMQPAPAAEPSPATAADPVTKIGSGYRVDAPILVTLGVTQDCPQGVLTSLRASGSATKIYFTGKRPSKEVENAFVGCIREKLS